MPKTMKAFKPKYGYEYKYTAHEDGFPEFLFHDRTFGVCPTQFMSDSGIDVMREDSFNLEYIYQQMLAEMILYK